MMIEETATYYWCPCRCEDDLFLCLLGGRAKCSYDMFRHLSKCILNLD